MRETAMARSGGRRLSSALQEALGGYLFTLPALVALVLFMIIPICGTVLLSFTRYTILEPPKFVGVANFERLLADERLRAGYRNSLLITLGSVGGNNLVGLLLALGVNRRMSSVLKYVFRTAYFFPVMTTTASLALVWRFLLAPDRGVLNWVLVQVGLAPVPWLSSPVWAIRSVVLYDVWKSCGYLMVLYLAGLQGISETLYEAARIDGANRWQLTSYITLPLLTPTVFFCLIISSIGAFQIFDNAYVLTQGGPGDASRTITMYIYEMGFKSFDMGYAAAVALSLLVILVTLTVIQFFMGRRWVHYD